LFFLLLFLHLLLLALFLVFLTTLVSHRPAPCSPLWLVTTSASQTPVSFGGMAISVRGSVESPEWSHRGVSTKHRRRALIPACCHGSQSQPATKETRNG
jgi:hypothetical protein